MTEQKIIYVCTAVAALAVAIATPGSPSTIEMALQQDGNAFCVAAVSEARTYAPNLNWLSQRLRRAEQPSAEAGRPYRLTCTTENANPVRITFDAVCPRPESGTCVDIQSISDNSGMLFEKTALEHHDVGALEP